jgi:hypothetical protein
MQEGQTDLVIQSEQTVVVDEYHAEQREIAPKGNTKNFLFNRNASGCHFTAFERNGTTGKKSRVDK